MSRTLTSAQLSALHAQSTSEAFHTLLTLTHTDFAATIRWVDNTEDVVSNGNTFTAAPFAIRLPDDDGDKGPRAEVVMTNVDRSLVAELRSISGKTRIAATVTVVMASDPDTAMATFENFDFINITFDAQVIQGELVLSDFLSEPYPGDTFTPADFPALF